MPLGIILLNCEIERLYSNLLHTNVDFFAGQGHIFMFCFAARWSCFINQVKSKMDNLPEETNLFVYFVSTIFSPNEATSHNGRTITNIKSKANVFIHQYARVSKLNMSRVDRDLNCQFKNRQRNSWPWQHSTFISQVTRSFGSPEIIIHIQLILFSCSLSTYLEGCHNHSIAESWGIS